MKKVLTDADRERIIEAVRQSKSSEGWIYVRETVLEWKRAEEHRLAKYQVTGISQPDIEDYNRCIDRIAYLERFMKVHDIIEDFNKSILMRMRDYMGEKYKEAESFVREVI